MSYFSRVVCLRVLDINGLLRFLYNLTDYCCRIKCVLISGVVRISARRLNKGVFRILISIYDKVVFAKIVNVNCFS